MSQDDCRVSFDVSFLFPNVVEMVKSFMKFWRRMRACKSDSTRSLQGILTIGVAEIHLLLKSWKILRQKECAAIGPPISVVGYSQPWNSRGIGTYHCSPEGLILEEIYG